MYFDNRPCQECGSEVRLEPHEPTAGKAEPDATVDHRVCTNAECPTNTQSGPDAPQP